VSMNLVKNGGERCRAFVVVKVIIKNIRGLEVMRCVNVSVELKAPVKVHPLIPSASPETTE